MVRPTKIKSDVLIIPSTTAEKYDKQVSEATKFSSSLTVRNDDDYQTALEQGKRIKEWMEIIKTEKDKIAKPQYAAYKATLAFFKPFEEKCESALGAIKAKMLDYTSRKQAQAEAKKDKIAEQVESGKITEEKAVEKIGKVQNVKTHVVGENGGKATTRTVMKYRVSDITKVPPEYLVVDMVKVRAAFKAGIVVPGIEGYEEQELSISL